MRRPMHALVGLLITCTATPTLAELQWQSTGVRQASHTAPANQPRVAPKAPSVVRPAAKQPVRQAAAVKEAPVVRQAVAVAPPNPAAARSVRVDPAVQPACGQCGCVGGCDCGTTYYNEPGCLVEPGCGVVGGCGGDPSCGLTYGEPCGCGDIGCGGTCGIGCGDGVGCGDAVGVPLMIYLPPVRELTFDVGVQAFKNPLDRGRDRGNFGVNAGVNLGGAMTWLGMPALGYQLGYRAASSQLHGDATAGTSDAHTQSFFTGGLFHRKAVGLQYGVVYDLLRDERQRAADFGQIRGLVSVTNPRGHEIGFQFATHVNENVLPNATGITYHATDQYLLFYRMHGCQGGEFRVFGGFDNDSKGLLGADFSIPLTDRWGLETGFTYVIPEEDANGLGAQQEAWNLGMNLVWHYGKRARKSYMGQYRPMFRVADNGSLIIADQQ